MLVTIAILVATSAVALATEGGVERYCIEHRCSKAQRDVEREKESTEMKPAGDKPEAPEQREPAKPETPGTGKKRQAPAESEPKAESESKQGAQQGEQRKPEGAGAEGKEREDTKESCGFRGADDAKGKSEDFEAFKQCLAAAKELKEKTKEGDEGELEDDEREGRDKVCNQRAERCSTKGKAKRDESSGDAAEAEGNCGRAHCRSKTARVKTDKPEDTEEIKEKVKVEKAKGKNIEVEESKGGRKRAGSTCVVTATVGTEAGDYTDDELNAILATMPGQKTVLVDVASASALTIAVAAVVAAVAAL